MRRFQTGLLGLIAVLIIGVLAMLLVKASTTTHSHAQEQGSPTPEPTPTTEIDGGRCVTPVWPDAIPNACMSGDENTINVCASTSGGIHGTRVYRALWVSGINETTSPPITAWSITLTYSPTVVQYATLSQRDTLSEDWGMLVNTEQPGQITIDAMQATAPLTTSGRLLDLVFDVVGNTGEATNLTFDNVVFNQGDPPVIAHDGNFEVARATSVCYVYLPLLRNNP
jgi:hypothetical protein